MNIENILQYILLIVKIGFYCTVIYLGWFIVRDVYDMWRDK